MTVKRGAATKAIVDAVNAGDAGTTAADISDATATGIALVTAANAGAVRTAAGATATGSSLLTAASAAAALAVVGAAPALASAPGSASAAGTAGTVAYDATHIYVCISASTWVRASLATW